MRHDHKPDTGRTFLVTKLVQAGKPRIFRREEARCLLRSVLIYYKAQHQFELLGYAMLPDRTQLIVRPGQRAPLQRIMKDVWGNFSRKVNQRWNRRGAILRSKYVSKDLEDAEAIRRALARVHYAVVEAGLSEPACGTPFSSAANYRKGLGDMLVDVHEDLADPWSAPVPGAPGRRRSAA